MTAVPGRTTSRRLLIWAMLAVVAIASLGSLALIVAPRSNAPALIANDPLGFLSGIAVAVAYAIVFAILIGRTAGHHVAWIFGAVAVVASVAEGTWTYVAFASDVVPPRLPVPELVGWIGGLTIPAWSVLATRLALVFPDGQLLSAAWRRLFIVEVALASVAAACIAFGAGPILLYGVRNPFALPGAAGEALTSLGPLALLAAALPSLPAAWSVVLRYRRADRTGRLQLKWFVYAVTIFVAVALVFIIVGDTAVSTAGASGSAVWLAFAVSATFMPVAAMIAILRYRLYEIDRIIGRTFVYGALVAILAGLYSAGIQLFTWAFKEVTGQSSDGALVVTTLVLATTFTPIKGRLELIAARRLREPAEPASTPGSSVALDLEDPSVQAFAARVAAIVRKELEADRRA